jgi:purine-binding chemotaxis protein CheW
VLVSDKVQVACFFVGEQEYALDIMRIKEIINPVTITPVPRAPEFIEGIIELRGAFLPVVDLRKRFELEVTPSTRETKYVIVGLEGRIVGLIVDRVTEVRHIDTESISEPPDFAVRPEARFWDGVVKQDDRIVMLIALDQILSPAEKAELRQLERAEA